MKAVARQRPDDVVDTVHSQKKGEQRSISVGDARDVIANGLVTGSEGPYMNNGVPCMKVTFTKRYRARTLKVVAAASEGSPLVNLVSLQNVW